jgi:uncharacterized protein (TIGR03083 family)
VTTDALVAIYGQVSDTISGLDGTDLLRGSRCAGWTVGDVLYHLLLDARRALVTFASPADGEPDVDDVTYWQEFHPGDAGTSHTRHVRIVAAAYPDGALGHEWRDTAAAAVRAARTCPHDTVTTQGHVLRTRDFVATLVFEATVHYLDMTLELPDSPAPDMRVVRRVLDGLLGTTVGWDDVTYALKATGRVPLTDGDRDALGPLADRFPLTG